MVIEEDIFEFTGLYQTDVRTKLEEAETQVGEKIYRTFSANCSCGLSME